MLYYPPVGSIFVFSEFTCEEDLVNYLPPDNRTVPGYIYCCGEGDVSALFPGENLDPSSAYLTRGWYRLTYDNSEYYISNTHIDVREAAGFLRFTNRHIPHPRSREVTVNGYD